MIHRFISGKSGLAVARGVVGLVLGACGALAVHPVFAQGKPAEVKATVRFTSVSLEAAQLAAQAALADCRKRGATVSVAVTDRFGVPLALLRDPLAGMHTPDTATRKAWTAISFKSSTTELVSQTAPATASHGIRTLPQVAVIGGGLLLQAAGSIVGAIGVSGAPNGDMDDACAKAGINAIIDLLELG
ncbi:MAG: GlcG/HbpS family heme-binding protein [Burkholderiaceae bacterium]